MRSYKFQFASQVGSEFVEPLGNKAGKCSNMSEQHNENSHGSGVSRIN